MLKTVLASFTLALQNIRSHFFHTVLSVLGIVIGVAALVSILSLIDGMEQYAKDQITQTTSLKAIAIQPELTKDVNSVRVRKDSITVITFDKFLSLKSSLKHPAQAFLRTSHASEVEFTRQQTNAAAYVSAITIRQVPEIKIIHGRLITQKDVDQQEPVAVISISLAKIAAKDSIASLVNNTLKYSGRELTIVGIIEFNSNDPNVFIPFTLLSDEELRQHPPTCIIEAENIEDVTSLRDEAQQWINENYVEHANDFRIVTNEFRVQQASQGFLLFRVIMGLIVGISVLVGGIGVMNVLLISVTERTVEIGIRKAVGANKRDILLQFLSESITISVFGSFLGLALGVIGTVIFIPIIKALTKIPFQASYTLNTFMVIVCLAIVVGIIFGTYPAMRASRLDPVEAMRRE